MENKIILKDKFDWITTIETGKNQKRENTYITQDNKKLNQHKLTYLDQAETQALKKILQNNEEWIATEWTNKKYFDSKGEKGENITIKKTTSNSYKGEKYAIYHSGRLCLNKKGEWGFEPLPSNRTKQYYKEYRFATFEEACTQANKIIKSEK